MVLLCDSRRAADLKSDPELLEEEIELCAWLREIGRPVVPVMTKADKLSKHERKPAQAALQRALQERPVIFSSLTGEGTDERRTPDDGSGLGLRKGHVCASESIASA